VIRGSQSDPAEEPLALPRGQIYAWAVLLGAIVVGAVIWLVPTLFADPSEAREVVVTILIGLAAILLGAVAVRSMRAEAGKRGFWRALIAMLMSELALESRPRASRAPAPRGRPEAEAARPETSLRLARVDLRDAVLPGADLSGTDMTEASLRGANLNAAQMHHSDLQGADLTGTDMRSADLRGSSLVGASLEKARLDRADLRGANLTEANLRDASLEGAVYDDETVWPEEPPPAVRGAQHVEESS
jgi:hypothetical protein